MFCGWWLATLFIYAQAAAGFGMEGKTWSLKQAAESEPVSVLCLAWSRTKSMLDRPTESLECVWFAITLVECGYTWAECVPKSWGPVCVLCAMDALSKKKGQVMVVLQVMVALIREWMQKKKARVLAPGSCYAVSWNCRYSENECKVHLVLIFSAFYQM